MTTDSPTLGYAHPDRLVSTSWVADHQEDLNHPGVKVLECDEDSALYDSGHVPGAIKVDWVHDLMDHEQREFLDRAAFQARMSALGIDRADTLVFYGDQNNWWACEALWVFTMFGHADLRIMDGGRAKWLAEGRPMSTVRPTVQPTTYVAPERNDRPNRAFRDQILAHMETGGRPIDVRSPDEYRGKRLNVANAPDVGAMRAGHIPGATNMVWVQAVDEDGMFRPVDELRRTYERVAGLSPSDSIVLYCRSGERASHTWFMLRYLLGFRDVRVYDGSWTEWGNLVGAPIER